MMSKVEVVGLESTKVKLTRRVIDLIKQKMEEKEFGATYIASIEEIPFLQDMAEDLRVYGYNVAVLRNGLTIGWVRVNIKC